VQHDPDLHVFPVPHVHVMVVPVHESVMFVHELAGHVTVGHSHVFPVHVFPPLQPPHETGSPHVFVTVPHLPVHAAGGGGAGHLVQLWRVPPQPSETPVPGSHTPGLAHVSGVHPQVFVNVLHAALVH
jgi:hypothetical protein